MLWLKHKSQNAPPLKSPDVDPKHIHFEHEWKEYRIYDMVMQAALTFGEKEAGDPFCDSKEEDFYPRIGMGIVGKSIPLCDSPIDNVSSTTVLNFRETKQTEINNAIPVPSTTA